MRLEDTPMIGPMEGLSKKVYLFEVYNIDDEISHPPNGVYIFTIKRPDDRVLIPTESHLLISFNSVKDSAKEAIEKAKQKGAEFIFYYSSMAEHERQFIINDIKASEDYQYQLTAYTSIVGLP